MGSEASPAPRGLTRRTRGARNELLSPSLESFLMSLILVVEPEERYIQRVQDALGSEGWRAQTVGDRSAALQAAASEEPSLVLVSTEVEGASALIESFARRSGGPGVVAIVEEAAAGGASAEGMGADDLLTKPFTDQQLRLTVRRGLVAASKPAPKSAGPGPSADADARFTAADIFGDVVAEVESQLASDEPAAAPPAAVPASSPPAATPSAPAAPSAPAPAPGPSGAETMRIPVAGRQAPDAAGKKPAAAAKSVSDDDEIERRLEQTLSGVLGGDLEKAAARSRRAAQEPATQKPPAQAPPPQAPAAQPPVASPPSPAAAPPPAGAKPAGGRGRASGDIDVDSLLSDTLTGLDPRAKSPKKKSPAEVEDPLAGLDLSGLEEVARPKRAPSAPAAAGPSTGTSGAATATPRPAAPAMSAAAPATPGPEPSAATPSPPPSLAAGGAESAEPSAAPDDASSATVQEAERFGQYTLQERIAVGGMAEVWKARMRGVEGFQKTVAIKKILSHLTDNAEFVSMFIDEAKLAAQLNHPNIIHIYDLGKIADSYYIAMEYVEGRNLRTILDASGKRARPIPHGLAVLVAARLASALDYAHKKRDFDNRELGLVHRDVSPQNVLIGFEGTIKLCDFGIAKAVAKASHTQMGALKGKLQYMSPEQAWGRTVDARSDIFSLGSLLFEMLTGQRLFTGDSEISVLEAVRECQVEPPGGIVDGLPEGADEIVMKALAKEPDHRFQAASEMQAELEALLHGMKPTPGPAELTLYLEQLSGARPVETATPVASTTGTGAAATPSATGGTDAAEPAKPAAGESTGTGKTGAAATAEAMTGGLPTDAATAGTTGTGRAAATSAPGPIAPREGEVVVEEGGGRGRWLLIAAIVLAVALLVGGAFFVLRQRGEGTAAPAAEEPAPSVPAETVEPAPPLLEDAVPEDAEGGGDEVGDEATGEASAAAAGTEEQADGDPAADEDLEAMVAERLAERERTLRAEREAELRRLEAELAATKESEDGDEEEPAATARGEPEPTEEAVAETAVETADPTPAAAVAADAGDIAADDEAGDEAADDEAASPGSRPATADTSTETTAPAIEPPSTTPSRRAPTPGRERARSAAGQPPPAPPEEPEPEPEPPAVREGDLVQPGPGVMPPKLVSIAKPEYPPVARRMRIQGDVILAVLVDERGRVIDHRFVERVRQNVGINEAALAAARQAEYEPATKDGVRVKMWTNLKLPFRL